MPPLIFLQCALCVLTSALLFALPGAVPPYQNPTSVQSRTFLLWKHGHAGFYYVYRRPDSGSGPRILCHINLKTARSDVLSTMPACSRVISSGSSTFSCRITKDPASSPLRAVKSCFISRIMPCELMQNAAVLPPCITTLNLTYSTQQQNKTTKNLREEDRKRAQ